MGESIVITSVGWSWLNYHYSKHWNSVSSYGEKVVVIDGDTGLRNLDVLMGLENRNCFYAYRCN